MIFLNEELDFIHLHVHGEDSNLRLLDSTNKNEKNDKVCKFIKSKWSSIN